MKAVTVLKSREGETRIIGAYEDYGHMQRMTIAELTGDGATDSLRLIQVSPDDSTQLSLTPTALINLVAFYQERNGAVMNEDAVARLIHDRDETLKDYMQEVKLNDAQETELLALRAQVDHLIATAETKIAAVEQLEHKVAQLERQESFEMALLKDVLEWARVFGSIGDDPLSIAIRVYDTWCNAPDTTPEAACNCPNLATDGHQKFCPLATGKELVDWSPDGYCPECDRLLPEHSETCALVAIAAAQGGK